MALVLTVREDLDGRPAARLPLRELIARADCEHGARHRLPPAAAAEIDRLWDEGATVPGIAALVTASETAIRDRLQARGAHEPRRPAHYGRVREILEARGPELCRAYQAGADLCPLAAGAGLSPVTLRRYLEGEGIAIRGPGRRRSA